MVSNYANSLNVTSEDFLLAPSARFVVKDSSEASANEHVFNVPNYYLDNSAVLVFEVLMINGWNKQFTLNVSDSGTKNIYIIDENGDKVPLPDSGAPGTVLEVYWDSEDFVVIGNPFAKGGGGGVEISADDYEALPEEEKMNGNAYFIPDADSVDINIIKDNITSDSTTFSSEKIMEVLRSLYPVGSIKISENNVNPGTYIPNTIWELKSSGRVLQGADKTHNGGDTIEAGLPNIRGTYVGGNICDGAFDIDPNTENNGFTTTSRGDMRVHTFNAGKSNPIYSDSISTVQPPAYVVYIWKRTA